MKFIGAGKTGKAYLLENGNVLKITPDVDEFEMAKRIMAENPAWASKIISTEEKNGLYYIEKSFVNPIYPKAGKTDSMNYGDARFEFTGKQYARNDSEFQTMEHISKILGSDYKKSNGIGTIKKAIAPFQMCQPNDFGSNFNVEEFDPKSISKYLYKNKKERKLFDWFVVSFFQAKKFGAFTKDLYQNIGIDSEGNFCFFDVN